MKTNMDKIDYIFPLLVYKLHLSSKQKKTKLNNC